MTHSQIVSDLPKNYETDDLNRALAIIIIGNPAATDDEISTKLNICRKTANKRRNSPEVRKLVADALSIPKAEVARLMAKALSKMDQLLDSPDPRISFSAANAVLKFGEQFVSQPLVSANLFANTIEHSVSPEEMQKTTAYFDRLVEERILRKLEVAKSIEPILSIDEISEK